MSVMEEGRITIDSAGRQVYYRKYGDAPNTLLGLHGGPGGDHSLLTTLERLVDDDLELVVYDQLGSGRSDKPEDPSVYVVDRFVEEVEAVRTELELGRVHLLGRSWGGMLALQYTLDHPEAVESLIVSNAAPSTALICQEMSRLQRELSADQQRALLRYEAEGNFGHPEFQDVILELTARHIRRCFPWDPERSKAQARETMGPLLEGMGGLSHWVMWGEHEFRCRGNLIDWDVVDRLPEIAVPVLLLCGYFDEVGVEANRLMADRIPDNEFVIFGNSSHVNVLEKEADLYHAVVGDFLHRQIARVSEREEIGGSV
jgi:proline iminopeptidase